MKDQDLDELMREYETEVAAYRRLPQSEPTALLDRAILTKAHAAVAHSPPVQRRPPRWIAMAASFAGIALAAGVGWRVYEAKTRESLATAPATDREPTMEVQVFPETRDTRALDMAQMPPAPVEQAAANLAEKRAEGANREALKAEAEAAPALVQRKVRAAEPDPHAQHDHAEATRVPELRRNVAAAPAPAPAPPAPMPAAAAAASAGASMEAEAIAPEVLANESVPSSTLRAKRSEGGRQEAPEAWLARIRTLIDEGHYTEARNELHQFQKQYPNAVVPLELRRFLP